jgi:cytochrome b561
MLNNNQERYGLISKSLHWLLALMILSLIAVGAYMTDLDKQDAMRGQIYALHKAFGVTVLGLVLLRVLWIKLSRPPELPVALRNWEKILSRTVKVLLYILMLSTPVIGYLMSNAADKPISFFGLAHLPAIVAPDKDLAETLGEAHELLAFTMLTLVGLHVAGALKHRFVDRTPDTDVLKRML